MSAMSGLNGPFAPRSRRCLDLGGALLDLARQPGLEPAREAVREIGESCYAENGARGMDALHRFIRVASSEADAATLAELWRGLHGWSPS